MKIKRALISVYDKTGIVSFARELSELGIEIVATSGTLKILENCGIQFVTHISEVTNFPEMLNGRVKTEHPKLIGGILALRSNKEHMDELKKYEIKPIDMVICNLHPIENVINQENGLKFVMDKIDIGGPNMIRAAAKNFENIVVIVNPNRYDQVLRELKKNKVSMKTRFQLAMEAFSLTARYDSIINKFLKKQSPESMFHENGRK